MLYSIGYALVKPVVMLLFRPKVVNRKGMLQKGKVIYVSNHMVLGDPIVVGILSNRRVHFMAKSTLSDKPFGRWLFKQLLTFPVQQYTADRKALKEAITLLNQGKAFGIFPEGHRCADGVTMDVFDKGCAFIAMRADAPIVPIYVMPGAWKLGNRIRAAVGEPIYPSEVKEQCPGRKAVDALNNRIMDAMMTLREQAEAL